MPTYHSTGTHIALSTSDLASSTTLDASICNTAKAKENIFMTESALLNGSLLNEQPISINGKSFMGFLGAEKDMPYFLVHINGERLHKKSPGTHLQQSEYNAETERKDNPVDASKAEGDSSLINPSILQGVETTFADNYMCTKYEKGTRETIRKRHSLTSTLPKSQRTKSFRSTSSSTLNAASPPDPNDVTEREPTQNDHVNSPQALTLTVSLDPKSHIWHRAKPSAAFDVKIEVFYNGDFAACRLVSSKSRRSARGILTKYFSGKRTHKTAEHAWNVNFEYNDSDLRGNETFLNRWHAIGRMLRKEANLRGKNRFNQRSPTGQFLADLSELDMPEALKHTCAKSNRRMGIIDVVMSLGKGRKFTTNSHYLAQPKRLSDPDFSVKPNNITSENIMAASKRVESISCQSLRAPNNLRSPDLTINPATAWAKATSLIARGEFVTENDNASIGAGNFAHTNENFSSMIAPKSTQNLFDRSKDIDLLARENLADQTEVQVHELSHLRLSEKNYPRKKPVQGSGRTRNSPYKNSSSSTINLAGSDVSPREKRCHETENSRIKIPRSRKRPCEDLSVESRRLSILRMHYPQSGKSKTLPRKSPHTSDSELSTASSTTSIEANLNYSLRRGLRSGVAKNYSEAQSSSSTTSELPAGGIPLQSQLVNKIASDESNLEHHETLNWALDMSDGAVASYARAGPWSNAGQRVLANSPR